MTFSSTLQTEFLNQPVLMSYEHQPWDSLLSQSISKSPDLYSCRQNRSTEQSLQSQASQMS